MMKSISAVKKVILRCVTCRRLRAKVGEQIMADVPHDRLKEELPFTYCVVDIFGPFLIKERRHIGKICSSLYMFGNSCHPY